MPKIWEHLSQWLFTCLTYLNCCVLSCFLFSDNFSNIIKYISVKFSISFQCRLPSTRELRLILAKTTGSKPFLLRLTGMLASDKKTQCNMTERLSSWTMEILFYPRFKETFTANICNCVLLCLKRYFQN